MSYNDHTFNSELIIHWCADQAVLNIFFILISYAR